MIKKIENFTYKSFHNYSGPVEEFAPINILFGYNGHGKSSLTHGIKKEFTKNNSQSEYRIFDRNYIRNNLLVSESEQEVKGVKVSFGENAQLNTKITALHNQIKDTGEIEEKQYENLENAKKIIDTIYVKRKKHLKIKKKTLTIENLDDVKKYYEKDFKRASNQFDNFSSNDSLEIDNIDSKLTQLPKPISLESTIKQIEKYNYQHILESSYKNSDNIPSQKVLHWIEEGLSVHDDHDNTCKFCGSSINIKNIYSKIEQYRSNEFQKVQKNVVDSLSIFEALSKKLSQYYDDYSQYSITSDYVLEDKREELQELLNSLLNTLNKKLRNISLSLESNHFLEQLYTLIDKLKQLQSNINQAINREQSNLYTLKNNQEIFVKGKIAEEILNSKPIKDYFSNIAKYQEDIKKINYENQKIQSEIYQLESQMNDYGLFSELINKILLDLNLGFELSLSNNEKSYILKDKESKQHLGINDISEGEGNLLAFIYFYYELFSDEQQKSIRPEIKMILLDDPISSLDQNNSYYLLELISNLIDKIDFQNQQIFIFTHVWDHYCQLLYKRQQNASVKAFEILKEDNKSNLRFSKKNDVAPYVYSFSEIYKFSKKKVSEIDESELYVIPNTMRRVLEEFLSFKTSGNILAQSSNKDKILDLYSKATKKDMSNNKKCKLQQMLVVINVLSHNSQKSLSEVHSSAKFMINFMNDIDSTHVAYLKHCVSSKC